MTRDNEEPVKKFIVDKFSKPSEAPAEVEVPIEEEEVPIVEVPTQFKRRGRPPKASKEVEKQAKGALEEEEALFEENLVETLSQRSKRLKKLTF